MSTLPSNVNVRLTSGTHPATTGSSMPTLTKSETVMDLACATEGCACRAVGVDGLVVYLRLDDDTQAIVQSIGIPVEKYGDLGQPEQITVAILPGDRLND